MSWRARSAWAQQLDFVGPRALTAWWAWALLGVGVFATLLTFEEFEKVRLAHEDAAAQIRRLERADRRARLDRAVATRSAQNAASSVSARAMAPALQGSALAEARAVGLLVGYPWGGALAGLEAQASGHQAVLMGVSMSLGNGPQDRLDASWRVQALAKDDASALAWVASMPGAQLLSRERLAQPLHTPAGLYEFKINAQMPWPGPKADPVPKGAS